VTTSTPGLGDLRRPVIEELKRFDGVFRESLRSRVGLLNIITRYIIRQKGKKVRPLLVFLSAQATGGITDRTFRGATLVEILHTATLVHDDVVDDADTRRGFASINAVWKNKVAVLLGDYLLARGLLLSIEHGDHDFLQRTSDAVKRMSEGELLQIQKSRQLNLNEETYLQIIGDKTASLFSTCTEIGAMSATSNADLHRRLREYGDRVGIAFQIRDDLLDYLGKRSIIGKPTGIDIKEKKLTLPLIFALDNGRRTDAHQALSRIRKGANAKDVAWIVDFVERSGGIEYAGRKAQEFADQARAAIGPLPPSVAKDALMKFVDFVMQRST